MHIRPLTIITGGGRGIGRAIALRMAKETAVIVVSRSLDEVRAVCQTIKAAGGVADFVVGDVAEADTAARALSLAELRGWTVRNLVCNAGIARGGALVSFPADTWRTMFDVNVHGTFNFIRACLPAMIEQKQGAISIISSTLGLKGHKYDAAYSATKFALVGLAQSLAEEVKKHGIVVVPLCPGFVETEMTQRSIAGLMRHRQIGEAEARAIIAGANPQGRILLAEEIAEAVAFCSTTADRSISGKPMELTADSEPRILQLINWLASAAAPAKHLLVPVSGGTDSALVFYLLNRAYPDKKVFGVYAGKPAKLRCRDWFESVGQMIYLDARPKGNKEIWRWAQFQQLSHELDAWLVGSRNRTEEYTGLYSLASRVATFLPLAGIWKSQVMELCKIVGVPDEVTSSSRRADPDCGRPQSLAEIPLESIDTYLRVQAGELPAEALSELTAAQQEYLENLVRNNEFRRHLPKRGPALIV